MEELLKENYFLFSLPNTRMRTELDEIISYPKSYLSSSKTGIKTEKSMVKIAKIGKEKKKVIHYKIFNVRKMNKSPKETMNIMQKLDFIDQGYRTRVIERESAFEKKKNAIAALKKQGIFSQNEFATIVDMLIKQQNQISSPSDEVDQILSLSMPRTILNCNDEVMKLNSDMSDVMHSVDTLSSPSNN